MLTTKDLKALEKLLDKKVASIEESLDQKIEDSTLEVQKDLILLKAEMKREFKKVQSSRKFQPTQNQHL